MLYSIFILLSLIISGYFLTKVIAKQMSFLRRLSIGFGISFIAITILFYALMMNGILLNQNIVLLIVSSYVIIAVIFGTFKNKKIFETIKQLSINPKFCKSEWVLLIIILLVICYVYLKAVFWPISEWDALTLYDFRGVLFSQGYNFNDLAILDSYDQYNSGYYFAYPPSTSYMHSLFYVLGTKSPQIIYPTFFASLIVFFYSSLTKHIHRFGALFFTSILVIVPIVVYHASIPYTNLPYLYFYFISSILLAEYLAGKDRKLGILFIAGIMLAGSAWVRFVEPFYITNIIIITYYLIRRKIDLKSLLIYVLPVLMIRYFWSGTMAVYSQGSFITRDIDINLITSLLENGGEVFAKTRSVVWEFMKNNIFIFAALSLVIFGRVISKKQNYLTNTLLLIILIINLVMIVLGAFIVGLVLYDRPEIYDSLGRFSIYFYPFAIYLLATTPNIDKIPLTLFNTFNHQNNQ